MQEAATLLKIPVAALEEDLARMMSSSAEHGPANVSRPLRPSRTVAAGDGRSASSVPDDPSASQSNASTSESEDSAAPESNPPPEAEIALMEFLYGCGPDVQLADLLDACAPDEIFVHGLTCAFVRAYVNESRGEEGAILALGGLLPPCDRLVLEGVYLANNKAACSELPPIDNLKRDICRFWAAAVRRRLGALPATGDVALASRRAKLSLLRNKFLGAPWETAKSCMNVEVLGLP